MTILGKLNDATPDEWDKTNKVRLDAIKNGMAVAGGLCPPFSDTGQTKSNGDSTAYYELPKGASELQDLIEYRKMDFATANVFKAAWRDGKKVGTTSLYDWKKIRWFADRKIAALENFEQEERKYEKDNGIY